MFDYVIIEYQMVILSQVQDLNIRLIVISLFNNTKAECTYSLEMFEKLMQRNRGETSIIIVGHLSFYNNYMSFMTTYYEYHQLVPKTLHSRGGTRDLFKINTQQYYNALDVIATIIVTI